MSEPLTKVGAITLFVEDLRASRTFYQDVLGLQSIYEDEVSSVVRLENLMVNLLQASEASELIDPGTAARRETGVRAMFSIFVADVDAVCVELIGRGVVLLNGPIDRPWGKRTAAFADPAGNIWEIAQDAPGVRST